MSVVLRVRVEFIAKRPDGGTVTVVVPDRHPGQRGQLTDHRPFGGDEILVFDFADDYATLRVSHAGLSVEHPGVVIDGGIFTELLSTNLETVAVLVPGDTRRRRFTTSDGPADLILTLVEVP